MASNKPKKTANKSKSKKQTKTTVKSEKTEKPEIKAEEKKVETTQKVKEKKVETTQKVEKTEKVEKLEEIEETEEESLPAHFKENITTKGKKASEEGFFKYIFSRKYKEDENVLTIFQNKKIYGMLAAEVIGTLFLTLVLMTLGLYQPLYIFFVYLGVTALVWAVSGANLNPLVTVGMMATRRMSAIRGVLYILAQVLGAWLGYLIVSAFWNAGGQIAPLPEIAEVKDDFFWIVTLIEFMGAVMIGICFARALQYKRSTLTASMIVAGGITITLITVIIISNTFLGLTSNIVMNPAIALMYQILPSGGDNIGELLADIALALVTYVVFPMLGGTLGFYISDFMTTIRGDELKY